VACGIAAGIAVQAAKGYWRLEPALYLSLFYFVGLPLALFAAASALLHALSPGLLLNVVVLSAGFYELATHAEKLPEWKAALIASHGNPALMVGAAVLVFPKLALGLSGFETGVAMMPLVKGAPTDQPGTLGGRIKNTRKLLRTAALIMSVMLISSSFVTTALIPATG
jgi:hypothetical protein